MDQPSIRDEGAQPEELGGSGHDSCRYCAMLTVEKTWPRPPCDSEHEFASKAFHDQCTNCQAHDSYPKAACSFCKHLRLGHWFRCILPSLEDGCCGMESSHWVELDVSNYFTQHPESDCDLCRLLQSALRRPVQKISIEKRCYNGTNSYDAMSHSIGDFDKIEFCISVADDRGREGVENTIDVQAIESSSFIPFMQLGKEVNWDTVKRWDLLPSAISWLPVGFKVIDLDRQCLVEPSSPHHYATLSYVWGGSIEGHKELQATKENIELLKEPGVFSRSHLPATIRDAMTACYELGFQYLWVDRLCIVQDDENNEYNKDDQINGMDQIYASSSITIVAASGVSARDGISGISRQRPPCHSLLRWEELELRLRMPSLNTILAETPWNSRGWTFQERICASNPMFFTDHGVYAALCTVKDSAICTLSERPEMHEVEEYTRRSSYFAGVEEYTCRSLTLYTDILNAFKGAARRLYCGQNIIYGIPLQLFDDAILWQPAQWDRETRPPDIFGKQNFPSWAWCSFHGPVTYYMFSDKGAISGISASLASWAFPGPCGALTPVPFAPFLLECPNTGYGNSALSHPEWHVTTMNFAWKAGFFKKEYFTAEPSNQYHGPFERDLESTIMSKDLWYDKCLHLAAERGVRHSGNPDPIFLSSFLTEDRMRVYAKPGRILVFTQRASLELEYLSTIAFKRVFALWSPQGRWMGLIGLTRSIADMHFNSIQAGGRLQMDFLALSITSDYDTIWATAKELNMNTRKREDGTWEPRTGGNQEKENIDGWVEREGTRSTDSMDYWINDMAGDHKNDCGSWAMHEAEVSLSNCGGELHRQSFITADNDTPARVNVMLISQQDGVARRLGVGQVYMKRWKEANREFCTVVLE